LLKDELWPVARLIPISTASGIEAQERKVSDPDQAYILKELIRYLKDERSGAVSFGDMGPGWTAVRDGARQNTLRRGADEVSQVTARWDDLIRYLGLELTAVLGENVKQILDKAERTPTARQAALRDSLVNSGQLYAALQIPNVAGPLQLTADLRSRQITVTTHVDAPKEGRSKGRVSWLLRQLSNAPASINLEAKVARSTSSLAASLDAVRSTPEVLYPEANKEIRQFVLSYMQNMGLKRSAGKGSFIKEKQ
jgi:hypothetical protein